VVFRVLEKKIKIVTSPCEVTECQIFIQQFFKIVLYWCLDLIRHNIGTKLKLNKHIFDISIPFCHHLYPSATLKQYFTEFALA
jgi:hypothetical protein